MRSKFVLRARLLSGVLILVAIFLGARLYFVQIVNGEEYRESAKGQYVVETDQSIIDRGNIFFTKKDGTQDGAAVMQSGWRVAISPKDIKDADEVFAAIAAETELDSERFFASAAKEADPYEEVAFRISDDAATAIRAKKSPGVILVRDQWRYYPAGELAAHALGFVGFQGDKRVGVYGLERFWEATLSRTSSGLYVNPFAEIFMNLEEALTADPVSREGSIITTIEPSVETRLEETLEGVMETYSPKLVGGIVMDPKTGAIRAMGLRPAFDPNTYNTVENPAVFTNLLVEGIYEMGSIMKPLTMAAAIDAAAGTHTTTYMDRGCIEKSGETICNFDKKARNRVSMQEVLNQSLNLGISYAVDQMGHEVFGRYIHAYGLGDKNGVELPNEAAGNIRAIDSGYDVDYASAGFGQGIAVSAIGMTRALASLANEGVLPNPHVVSGVRFESGITRSVEPAE